MKAILLITCSCMLAHGQGGLTPPGPPGPTMKTLQQIESRSDVLKLAGDATAMHVITAPGSYYLTGKILAGSGKSGIRIAANHVTLDLMGFKIEGVPAGSACGIELYNSPLNPVITNGHVTGFFNLIAPPGPGDSTDQSATITEIHGNGAQKFGISVPGPESTVRNCNISATIRGIHAGMVIGCYGYATNGEGILAEVSVIDSQGHGYQSSIPDPDLRYVGISCLEGIVRGCTGKGITGILGKNVENSLGDGFYTGIKATNVYDSEGIGLMEDGIRASGHVRGSTGYTSAGLQGQDGDAGIYAGGNVSDPKGTGGTYLSGHNASGIISGGNVSNSTGDGIGDFGILASGSVTNSTGQAEGSYDEYLEIYANGVGIEAKIVTHSHGEGGNGIKSTTAIGCTSSGNNEITNKYLMP